MDEGVTLLPKGEKNFVLFFFNLPVVSCPIGRSHVQLSLASPFICPLRSWPTPLHGQNFRMGLAPRKYGEVPAALGRACVHNCLCSIDRKSRP